MFVRPLYGYGCSAVYLVRPIQLRLAPTSVAGRCMAAIREKPLSLVARSSLATLENIVNVDHPRPQLLPWGSWAPCHGYRVQGFVRSCRTGVVEVHCCFCEPGTRTRFRMLVPSVGVINDSRRHHQPQLYASFWTFSQRPTSGQPEDAGALVSQLLLQPWC
jgi:hypothetical protein